MTVALSILGCAALWYGVLLPHGSPWRDAAFSAAFALEATAAYLAEASR